MKPTGTGRIIIWRGGSLWIGYAGEPTEVHSHHAVQITLPLSAGKVQLRRPSESWKSFEAVIVAANQPHAFEARGAFIATIFVEPESRDGRALQQRCSAEGIVTPGTGLPFAEIAALATLYQQLAIDQELVIGARAVIAKFSQVDSVPVTPLDKRIESAVERIRERVAENVSLADVAADVCLSPERFRHLFVAETGLRFRPYVLWLRVETALAALTAGKSLTEAAHIGGFADSAHFSRTFKRMFGITPSSFQHE